MTLIQKIAPTMCFMKMLADQLPNFCVYIAYIYILFVI